MRPVESRLTHVASVQKRPLKSTSAEKIHDDGNAFMLRGIKPPHNDNLNLPPPVYREVPGSVRRRADQTTRAEAAPTTQPQMSFSSKSRPPRRKSNRKGQSGDNGDSDSGSDAESGRRDGHGDAAIRRRKAKPADTGTFEANLDTLRQRNNNRDVLSREEMKRMQHLRVLRNVEEQWDNVRYVRDENQMDGRMRMKALARHIESVRREKHTELLRLEGQRGQAVRDYRLEMDDTTWIDGKERELKALANKRKRYLDLVLYGDIESKLQEERQKKEQSDDLEQFLTSVEAGFIERCRGSFLGAWHLNDLWWKNPHMQPLPVCSYANELIERSQDTSEYLAYMVVQMYRDLIEHLGQPSPHDPRDVKNAVEFLRSKVEDLATYGWVANPLIDGYVSKIFQALADAAVIGVTVDQVSKGYLDITQVFDTSRNSRHLSQAYKTWMCAGHEVDKISELCDTWQRYREQGERDRLKKIMARGNIRQEFCLDVHRPGVVSLILFKENLPTTVRDVPAKELEDIGWFRMPAANQGPEYYEYQYRSAYSVGTKQSEKYLFKVTMNHEVLGLYLPNGEWVGWDESMESGSSYTGAIA
ncbi:hypothetical protein EsH8_IV_000511 [Colletotrichum jinshuiense]